MLVDEMKIKSGLVFNKSSGNLVGFMNLGDVNDNIEKLEMSIKEMNDQKKQAPELSITYACCDGSCYPKTIIYLPNSTIPFSQPYRESTVSTSLECHRSTRIE